MASVGAISFTLSKHQGSPNRRRTVQQNNELMEALSPGQKVQSLSLEIGSQSIIPTIQAATESTQFAFYVMTQKAPQLKPRPVHTPPKRA
ncbi:hypothetical protein [Synechococcus sp. MU1643]|uniref:hypothetical protein n=1 Tax=Synechococcus sp. MU1643 TaxID=2508349 RepID=UPI001CF865F6|nr:hypothetical protein [Synechococcus sp. MU1643]